MKNLTFLYCLFVLISCSTEQTKKQSNSKNSTPIKTDTIENLSDNDNLTFDFLPSDLIKLFKDTSFTELTVSSECDVKGCGKYTGQSIDINLFEFLVGIKKANLYIEQEWNLYACYKFEINNSLTGLIVRTPSQYIESSINLFVYNENKKKFYESVELADAFGDEGWSFSKESKLSINKNSIKVLSKRSDTEPYEIDSTDSNGMIEFEQIIEKDSTIISLTKFE